MPEVESTDGMVADQCWSVDTTDPARSLRARLHGTRLHRPVEAVALLAALERQLGAPLNQLHVKHGPYELFRPGRDTHTALHRLFYQLHKQLECLYLALCARVLRELIGEACFVQAVPCYRFGLPLNRWVGSYHRDSDFGHSPWELNAICALSPAYGSAALHVEDHPGSHRYSPLELDAADVVLFDHIDRKHGCPINREGVSVASMDFRFVPVRFAAAAFAQPATSLNTHTPLVPGGYFRAEPMDGAV